MPPKVSVVIPTYNNAALLGETLQGVAAQSFKDFELIVVDDGSTDETAAAIEAYNRGVRYVRQENAGPAAARNQGVSLARGEFIAFCDHDDVWTADHLQNMIRCFEANPAAALCFGDAEYFGENIAPARHIDPKILASITRRRVVLRRIWQCWIASMSVVMVRKSVFDSLGGLHAKIRALDDLHFYLRLGAYYEVRCIDYVSCKKRISPRNLLRQSGTDGLIACLEDLKLNHPDVVRAIGPLKVRMRLARRYRKLAEHHLRTEEPDAARAMFLKAYNENRLNLHDLWSYLFRARPRTGAFAL
jgi:glycosyltransferase involved in cell wall biosynthesis